MLKKLKLLIKKNKEKERKLDQLLNVFDDIKVSKDSIIIKFNKNIVCYSEGHQMFISKKEILIKSKNLHLNPNIQIENDVEEGKTNKVIKDVRYQNDKMLGIVDETLEYGKEIIKEEEENGCC